MELWNRLRDSLQRGRLTRDLKDELEFHHTQLARDARAAGLDDSEAAYAAHRRLGNTAAIAERTRDMWSFAWLDHLVQDVTYGLRSLRRNAGFAIVAILTLGLGIGANTAIFTVVNGVLFKPLPYGAPKRLVLLWETTKDLPQIMFSYLNYQDWKGKVHTFEDVALYGPWARFTLTGSGPAEQVRGGLATANLWDVLGVTPRLGRTFRAADDRVGAERVAIVTDQFWTQRFGVDSVLEGKHLTVDGYSYTIVGVLPPRVRLATVPQIWLPVGLFANEERFTGRANHSGLVGLGRLKPGVTLEAMRADLGNNYAQLRAAYPNEAASLNADGDWLLEQMVGSARPALYALAGAVALVLLIACANVANLVLGRAVARQREIALRVAIGAKRERIVRQLLTESVLLAVTGGALGVALALGGVKLLLALQPGSIPRVVDVTLDGTVLAFALGISVLTGVVFGLAPALNATRHDLSSTLKEGGRGASAGGGALRARSALMVAEVSLAVVLLVGAGLLVRSFDKLTRVDSGFDARNVMTGLVPLPWSKYPDTVRRRELIKDLVERAKAIPQVTAAAVATDLPIGSSWQSSMTFEGLPAPTPGREPLINGVVASPEWFATLGIRLLAGRLYTAADRANTPGVVVISEGVAKRFFGSKSPVGKRMWQGSVNGNGPSFTIIGVVNDVKDGGLGAESRGTFYRPVEQETGGAFWLVARTAGPAPSVSLALKDAVAAAISKDVPLASPQPLEERVAGSVAEPRFSMLMLALFASMALVLAAIGIYGVISYSVAQRTHEIGLRVALGARATDVLSLIVRQVLGITGIGIAIGAAGALTANSMLTKMLFGVEPTDPMTFAGVAVVLAVAALVAAAVPAWRAARLDPVTALRTE